MGPYFRYPETIEELVTDQRWFLVELKMMTFWAFSATAMLLMIILCQITSREERRWTPQERQERQELYERLLQEEEENKIDVYEAIKNFCSWVMTAIKTIGGWAMTCLGRRPDPVPKTPQTDSRGAEKPNATSADISAGTYSKSSESETSSESRPTTGTPS